MNYISVAAGIILRNNQVFLALRKADQHQGGLWEFPGGKCNIEEPPELALSRELKEECGIEVLESDLFHVVAHDYGDKQVKLFFFKVTEFEGEPIGKEGQEVRWVSLSSLSKVAFPEANLPIVAKLLSSD